MNELELACFKIISNVGTARSCYVEAIQKAKENKIEEAKEKIKEGETSFLIGHSAHAELLQKDAANEKIDISLLLLHAEDQLMSAEGFKIIAEEFIDNYQRIITLEKRLPNA